MTIRSFVKNQLKQFEKSFDVYNNIYISRSAILNNFDIFQKIVPNGYIIPILKSNAYGHGLNQIATILKDRKLPYIAVDGYYEGLKIHEISKQPVLVMGSIKNINYQKINPKKFTFVVHDLETIKAMESSGKQFKIHLEIETGMNRHGIKAKDLVPILNELKKSNNILLEGVMTHLADSDNPKSTKNVDNQVNIYDACIEKIIKFGLKPKYFHIANSAGSIKTKSKYANTLRIGIALYGITPLSSNDKFFNKYENLKPALTLTSSISKIQNLKKGESVSYGYTWTAKRNSRIGILPLGYYEGIPRSLSNIGTIKYDSKYLPIVGRICMNHVMIDITDSKIALGDEVIIISNRIDDETSIKNICNKNNLFNYSLLVGLNQNIRRTIVK